MHPQISENERSWAIELISDINLWSGTRDVIIKRAGGEHSTRDKTGSLFPDLLLFGDKSGGLVLQGWELKWPDTPITDAELINNARRKALTLGLESFLVWNVTSAVLYRVTGEEGQSVIKTWNSLADITRRDDVGHNRERIKKVLHEILDDLTMFFQEGTLRPRAIAESITNEGIFDVLLSGKNIYSERLEQKAKEDYAFEDQVNLWWRSAKNEHPQRESKWLMLAQINLVALVNKFVFVHLLKNYSSEAYAIDHLGDANAESPLLLFESLSEKVDFWSIFRRMLGDDVVPEPTWDDFMRFNALLKEFHLDSIQPEVAHTILTLLSKRSTRKLAGQVSTPPNLANLLVHLTIVDPNRTAIDPCCGTGTIARAIKDLKQAKGLGTPLETTWASDKFSFPLQIASMSLVEPSDMGKVIHTFKFDATELIPGSKVTFYEPFTGQEIIKAAPEFGYVISNLPFVRQEDLSVLNPNVHLINRSIAELTNSKEGLGSRSDLYAYLPFHLWRLVEDGGKLGIVISNAWLGTTWGKQFWNLLQQFYKLEVVLTSGEGRWFQNADVVTNILILSKRPRPSISYSRHIKYVTLKKPISTIGADQADELRALINTKSMYTDDEITIRSYTESNLQLYESLGISPSSYFTDLSWLPEVASKTIPANKLFQINRGERRGWDELFYPPLDIDIEQDYIEPVLLSPRSLKGIEARPDGVAFCCTQSKEELIARGHTKALRWIEKFEHTTNTGGKPLPEILKRSGMEWYTMRPDTLADYVISMNYGNRLFVGKFAAPTFVNQRLIRLSIKDPETNTDLLHALLNSVLGLFYLEALGFGRGLGALDLNATKVKGGLRVLDPSLLKQQSREDIITSFEKIRNRETLLLTNELNQRDRRDFDLTVLKAFALEDKYDLIREALLELYKIRSSAKA